MNIVRVNQVQRRMLNGAAFFFKRRRAGAGVVIWFANRFLALAHSGIRMFARSGAWIEWEIYCAGLLYPERPAVRATSARALLIPEVSGITLRRLLLDGEPAVTQAFVHAGRELRRVHQIPCKHYQAAWSHGDLHLDNVIYDGNSERAVLIDFDTRHELRSETTRRHSDDLKVILLELMGLADDNWSRAASAFVEEYGETSVLADLSRQLFVPQGFARLLWYTRTNCSSIPRIEPRLQRLREIIQAASA